MTGKSAPGSGAAPWSRPHPLSLALRDLIRAGGEVDPRLARRLDLNPTDYAAMNHLSNGAEQLGPVELGTRLGISSGSATGLVDRLEAAGHVRRQPHPTDRRRLVVRPTDSAMLNILEVLRPMIDDLDELGAQFTAAEQQTIERYLREAAERLRAYGATLERADRPGS